MLDVQEVLHLLAEEWTEWDWHLRAVNDYFVCPKGDIRPNYFDQPGSKHIIVYAITPYTKCIIRAWNSHWKGPSFSKSRVESRDAIDVNLHDPESLPKLKQFIAKWLA